MVMLIFLSTLLIIAIIFIIKDLRKLVKHTNTLTLSTDTLSIGKDSFRLEEIEKINMVDVRYISFDPYYGVTLTLKNGLTKFIPGEQYYSNDTELFKALDTLSQPANTPIQESATLPLEKEELISKQRQKGFYSFNFFTSINVLFLPIIAISLSGIHKYIDSPLALFFLAVAAVIYFTAMNTSYYFDIDGYWLSIRNKLLFGYSKNYDLDEIKSALIYTEGAGRNSREGIRIITHDYKSKFYSCNGFRKKKWNALAETLRANGVEVVNKFETEN